MKAYFEKRSYPSNMPLRIYRHVNSSFSFRAHWHSDIELVLVREGSVRFGVNREIRTLQQGDVALCCSGDIHFYDSAGMVSTIDILVFQPSLIGCHGNWPHDIRFKHSFLPRSMLNEYGIQPRLLDQVEQIVQMIYLEMQAREPYHPLFVTSKVMELCAILQRYLPSTPMDSKAENKRISSLKTMQEILQYLELNYMRPITLPEIASHFNLSVFHFCRLFHSLAGTHFKSFLNTIRVNSAEEWIRSGSESITHIAMECGFQNIRTFNRVFKSIKGYTPSSLRSAE
jgi:AraC-like DNA-binding protein